MNTPVFSAVGLPNSHLHTQYSFDSELPPESHAEDALKAGVCAITITDHCEVTATGDRPGWSHESVLGSYNAAAELREKYPQLEVYAGIELGQPTFCLADSEEVLSLADFDFVLGSMHLLRSGLDFYYVDYHECDPYEIYDQYLEEMLTMVKWDGFDSLAHMTYPQRYIIGTHRIDFDVSRYRERHEEILRILAKNGKALEINTSGARRENGFMLPDLQLVSRFRELGGKYITLGSDAHRPGHFASGLGEGAQLARDAGFDHVAVYEHHKPRLIAI